MMGQRRVVPRWDDDTVRRFDGWCWSTGQYIDSTLEGGIMEVGSDIEDGGSSFIKISGRA